MGKTITELREDLNQKVKFYGTIPGVLEEIYDLIDHEESPTEVKDLLGELLWASSVIEAWLEGEK